MMDGDDVDDVDECVLFWEVYGQGRICFVGGMWSGRRLVWLVLFQNAQGDITEKEMTRRRWPDSVGEGEMLLLLLLLN